MDLIRAFSLGGAAKEKETCWDFLMFKLETLTLIFLFLFFFRPPQECRFLNHVENPNLGFEVDLCTFPFRSYLTVFPEGDLVLRTEALYRRLAEPGTLWQEVHRTPLGNWKLEAFSPPDKVHTVTVQLTGTISWKRCQSERFFLVFPKLGDSGLLEPTTADMGWRRSDNQDKSPVHHHRAT